MQPTFPTQVELICKCLHVDTSEHRRKAGTTQLDLTAVGLVGPQGPTGATGATALTGATGSTGSAGSGSALFADVPKDGAVYASSGLCDASANGKSTPGFYQVKFNRDVTLCSWIASPATSRGVVDDDPATQLIAFGEGVLQFDPNTVEVIGPEKGTGRFSVCK